VHAQPPVIKRPNSLGNGVSIHAHDEYLSAGWFLRWAFRGFRDVAQSNRAQPTGTRFDVLAVPNGLAAQAPDSAGPAP